ncbi:unnamed protein product [Rotaria sp. Silwood1]|nr:unnamed protein product [Rotaria sp. Silwood1]
MENGVIQAYYGTQARKAFKNMPSFPRTNEVIRIVQLLEKTAVTLDGSRRELTSWLYQNSASIESTRLLLDDITISEFALVSIIHSENIFVLVLTNNHWIEIYSAKSLNNEPLFSFHLRSPARVHSTPSGIFYVVTCNGIVYSIIQQITSDEQIQFNQTVNIQLKIQCSMMFSSVLTLNGLESLIVVADNGQSMAIWNMQQTVYIDIDVSSYVSSLQLKTITGERTKNLLLLYFNDKSLISCQVNLDKSNDKGSLRLTSFDRADKFCLKSYCLAAYNNGKTEFNLHNIHSHTCYEPIQLDNECQELCLNETATYDFALVKPRVLFMYRINDYRQLAKLFVYDFVSLIITDKEFLVLAMNDRQKRKELYAKRGRGNQFTSKEDRDKWIRIELKSLTKAIHDKREQMERLKKDLQDDTIKSHEIEEQLRQIVDNENEQRTHMDNVNIRVRDLRQKKSDIATQKTELARKETQLHIQISQTRDELRKYQDTLRSIINKGAALGTEGLQRLLRQFADENRNQDIINGYHGTLIENLECDPTFYTAVEVIAGNRLNYHIVDSDIIATRLVKEFNSARQRGEIHFLPLNVLDIQNNNLPKISGASPLIDQLQWIPKAEKAVRHVFNRIMLCEDFNSATRTARQYDVDCVTLDGDQVQRKGALTGGYIDKKVSRLELQHSIKQLSTILNKYEQEYKIIRNEIMNIDNEYNNIMAELQREDMKSKKNWDNYEQMKSDAKYLQSELDRIVTHRPGKERQLNTLIATIEQFCAKEESLQSEVGSDLVSQLTVDEQTTIDKLNDTIEQITQELKEIIQKRVELESTKTKLEHQIANNYRKNRNQINTDLERMHIENARSVIEDLEREYTILSDKLNEHEKQTDAIDRIINNLDKELKNKQKELEQLKNSNKDIDEHINEEKRNTDKYEVKLRNAQNKLDESTKRQNDIGVPPDGLDKYKDIPIKQLQHDLDRAIIELKKYAHVNKKALDQFLQFSDERDKLTNRKAEIDEAHRHIVDLIESLDNKRFETIQFTFKQVSLYFTEVFKRLVPEGTAHLVIKKGDNEDFDSEQVSLQSPGQQMSVDDFTGVGIKVSFNGRTNEMRDMQQLSGGQKSLVALALIFAIQKCDPAPFYLFDEIDQALDPQYRNAVAEMINELSQKAQFIITTFGPDLLKYGDKFYGITYRNKVSQIRSVTQEEALEFVEDNEIQNQVAQPTTVTTSS